MKNAALLLLFASTALGQQQPHKEIYPSDYTPSPCARPEPCEAFKDISFISAAPAFLLRELDAKWNDVHSDELMAMTRPYCVKRATCNASPGRVWWFCNDVFAQEIRATCDTRFDPKTQKEDNTQCHTWMDTFSAGVDQHGSADWAKSQKCSKEAAQQATAARHMDWWSAPVVIAPDYKGPIQIFAIDHETHIPVQGDIRFEEQIIYTPDAPNGTPTTYYQFKWPRKLLRVPNAQGHTDVVPVKMTITAPGYETVSASAPTIVPKMNVSVTPAADKWKRGTNHITVNATDSFTGKPVEAQVYFGTQTLGFTNRPLDLTIENQRKRPDIWVRSPFDAYSDVVVVPAKK